MNHEILRLIDAPAGSKYLLRFVGNPIPSRCVYARQDANRTRYTVVDAIDKLEEKGVKIYHEAFATCMDMHGDGCLEIAHLPEPLVLAIQRFVQAGGPDPGAEESVCFLIEIGTGSPVMMTIRASKPNDLEPSVYERAAGMKNELFRTARGDVASTAEILELHARGLIVDPYLHEGEMWFEPHETVERTRGGDKRLYRDFITYVSECCDDEDVAMIAGILCRAKEKI